MSETRNTKRMAGEKWTPIDSKTATVPPLKSPAEIAAARAKAEAEAAKEKFPGFAESLKLLAQLKAEPVETPEEWQAKQPRIEALKKHIHLVQQGLPVTYTTGNDQVVMIQRHAKAPEHRAARIAALQNFLAQEEPSVPPVVVYDLKGDPKTRLLSEPEVLKSVWRCRRLLAQAEIFELENFDVANPITHAAELELAIQFTKDTAKIRDLTAQIAAAKAVAGRNLGEKTVQALITDQFQIAMKEIAALLLLCKTLLATWQKVAEQEEQTFFDSFTLPAERTKLSLRFVETEKTLPTISRASLDYFGVADVAAV